MSGSENNVPAPPPPGFSQVDLQADMQRRAEATVAAMEDSAVVLATHFQTALTNALSDAARIALICGVQHPVIDEAMQRALAAVAIGTWQTRLSQAGSSATPRDAGKAMAALIAGPKGKGGKPN